MNCVYKKAMWQIDKSRYLSKVCLLPAGQSDKKKIIVCVGFCRNIKCTDFMLSCSSLLCLTDKVHRHTATKLHSFLHREIQCCTARASYGGTFRLHLQCCSPASNHWLSDAKRLVCDHSFPFIDTLTFAAVTITQHRTKPQCKRLGILHCWYNLHPVFETSPPASDLSEKTGHYSAGWTKAESLLWALGKSGRHTYHLGKAAVRQNIDDNKNNEQRNNS